MAGCGYLANAVKAPLTYVAVFFILQWLWDFVILGKLHGYVQHLFELTGEGNGCPLWPRVHQVLSGRHRTKNSH